MGRIRRSKATSGRPTTQAPISIIEKRGGYGPVVSTSTEMNISLAVFVTITSLVSFRINLSDCHAVVNRF
jgi:hypothetical protein